MVASYRKLLHCSQSLRYSEFDKLRMNLVRSFPHAEAMIPQLPRKSVVSRFRPEFLEKRKAGLSHFLKYVQISDEHTRKLTCLYQLHIA